MLATDLTAWTQLLAFTSDPARRWEPKRLRLRVFSIPPPWLGTVDDSFSTSRPQPHTLCPGYHRLDPPGRPGRARLTPARRCPDRPSREPPGTWTRRPPRRHAAPRHTPMTESGSPPTDTASITSPEQPVQDPGSQRKGRRATPPGNKQGFRPGDP